jgi:hypothetical protein
VAAGSSLCLRKETKQKSRGKEVQLLKSGVLAHERNENTASGKVEERNR